MAKNVKKTVSSYFIDIKGESQYTKTQFDFSFREEWTRNVASVIEDLITNGYARKTIIKSLMLELNFKLVNAQALYTKVEGKLFKSGLELKKVMLAKNIIRLEKLYREAVDEKNVSNCLKVIELLNKTCDLYKNNIEISQNNFVYQLGLTPTVPEHLLETENNNENIDYVEYTEVEENNEETEVIENDE